MLTLSTACLAIALADKRGTLMLTELPSGLGGTYVAIGNDRGVIEVANNMAEAMARVASVRAFCAIEMLDHGFVI
jgi:hypothetical protein